MVLVESLLPEDGSVGAQMQVVFRGGGKAAAEAFAARLRASPGAVFPMARFKDVHLEHITRPFLVSCRTDAPLGGDG